MFTPAALGWAALVPLVFAGCQSNAQQDLIARELRMQEDQLYAMEDYLSQYQQLVCKYRSENAALRRRLTGDYYDAGEEVPAPRTTPGTRPGTQNGRNVPAPQPGDVELELPEVPPLEDGTSDDTNLEFRPSDALKSGADESAVVAASYEAASTAAEAPVAGEAASAAEPTSDEPIPPSEPSSQVWLHGEVVANDAGGGPRLAINVEPLDRNVIAIDGQLSLMLVATAAGGGQQKLARWDFDSEELRSAFDQADGEQTMRFYLELPAEVPIGEATQLWVQLLPRDGSELLAHADVDLSQPGEFSSQVEDTGPISIPSTIASSFVVGDWSTALPGEPANLPATADDSNTGWRASSEAIAVTVKANAAVEPTRRSKRPAVSLEAAQASESPTYKRPTWSPDRSGSAASRRDEVARGSLSARAAWSATR